MQSGKIRIAKTDILILTLLLNNIDFTVQVEYGTYAPKIQFNKTLRADVLKRCKDYHNQINLVALHVLKKNINFLQTTSCLFDSKNFFKAEEVMFVLLRNEPLTKK